MKKILILCFVFVMALSLNVFAASIVSTDGSPNDSGIYPVQVDSDRVVTFAADAGIKLPYEAVITSDTLTAKESGKTISMACTTPCEIELPAAKAGMNFAFVEVLGTATFSVDPNGTDQLYLDSLSAGDKAVSPGAIGNVLEIFSAADGYWAIKNEIGAFSDGN